MRAEADMISEALELEGVECGIRPEIEVARVARERRRTRIPTPQVPIRSTLQTRRICVISDYY